MKFVESNLGLPNIILTIGQAFDKSTSNPTVKVINFFGDNLSINKVVLESESVNQIKSKRSCFPVLLLQKNVLYFWIVFIKLLRIYVK